MRCSLALVRSKVVLVCKIVLRTHRGRGPDEPAVRWPSGVGRGHNVRLLRRLTGWDISISSPRRRKSQRRHDTRISIRAHALFHGKGHSTFDETMVRPGCLHPKASARSRNGYVCRDLVNITSESGLLNEENANRASDPLRVTRSSTKLKPNLDNKRKNWR